MRYKGRDLRRLFEIDVYVGDPNAETPETRTVTSLGVNAQDAIRRLGRNKPATYPKALHYVTWPEPGHPATEIYQIDDTAGPTGDILKPDFMRLAPE